MGACMTTTIARRTELEVDLTYLSLGIGLIAAVADMAFWIGRKLAF